MKVLALVDAPDHVCCRYRVRAFAPALEAAGATLTVEGLASGVADRCRQLRRAGAFDAVLLQRKLLSAWEFGLLRRSARRLVFDLDDAVFWRDSYDARGPFSARRMRRFARTVRGADAVLAGNDFLVGRAIHAGGHPGRVRRLPTCVDPARYRPRDHGPTDRPRLVWIGSSSTMQGLEARRPLWWRIAEAVPGVELLVICDRSPDLGAMPVRFVPWSEATEAEALLGGDVGVAMVPDDLWSRGKCGLKVLQYLAGGLPVIADPVGVHGEMVRPGHSGFLPRSDDQWVEAVATLAGDDRIRKRMGSASRRLLIRHYAVDRWAADFVAAVLGVDARSAGRPHLTWDQAGRPARFPTPPGGAAA